MLGLIHRVGSLLPLAAMLTLLATLTDAGPGRLSGIFITEVLFTGSDNFMPANMKV